MNTAMKVRQSRDFGDIITDPFKLIFRNIRVLFPFSMLYIFLPMALALGGVSYIQMTMLKSSSYPVVAIVITLIAGFISFLNTSTTAFALTKSADDVGFENVDRETLKQNFFGSYRKNFNFTIVSFLLLTAIFSLFFVFVFSSPMFGAIVIFLLFVLIFFYLGPLWVLANSVYLFQRESSFTGSFSQARDYLMDHYASVWGTFVVTGIVNTVLRTSFSMPFSILYMLLLSYTQALFGNEDIAMIITLVQSTIIAFASTFLVQYISISMHFKYFDVHEKEYGENLLAKIANMGETKESYFENEGEF